MYGREEIENTLSRFMNSFDLKDWLAMAGVLAPTLHVDYSDLRGDPPMDLDANDYIKLRVEALQHLSTQHLLTNLDVRTTADSASVDATCLIFRSDGNRRFDSHVFYTFALVRLAGNWRISGIKQRLLWSEGDPTLHKGAALRRS